MGRRLPESCRVLRTLGHEGPTTDPTLATVDGGRRSVSVAVILPLFVSDKSGSLVPVYVSIYPSVTMCFVV